MPADANPTLPALSYETGWNTPRLVRQNSAATLADIDILFLCTGNICRSPMAEGLLRKRLADRRYDATVHSAGLSLQDQPASQFGIEVMAARGVDTSAHRSRIFTRQMIAGADLVIGMARTHVREAVVAEGEAWARAYTLKEIVRRGTATGPRQRGQKLDEWLALVHEGRSHHDLLGADRADDVADPIGGTKAMYETTATEIDDLVERLANLAFPEGHHAT
ncbi:MAG: hypothetical protein ACR2H3_07485 [Acidimicrobiales bacterium]